MDTPVNLREQLQPGSSGPEQFGPVRSKTAAAPRQDPVSPPDSDEDGSSSEGDDDSDAGEVGTARDSPSKPPRDAGSNVRHSAAATAPPAGQDMMVVSESKLREMMRQEIESLLKTFQSQTLSTSVPESKSLDSVPENRAVQDDSPTRHRPPFTAPFQASVSDAPGTAASSPRPSISPGARHSSVASTGRASNASGTTSAPQSPSQSFSTSQASIIDEKWGRLFDPTGQPTSRAEDVFRSLADHIIAELAPQKSIVVTPEKLARFYSQHRLPNELFAFATMFTPRTTDQHFYDRIADLYEDLGCQYHLVQKDSRSRPTVPGLTPLGFAQWLIANIQAYPDEETQRLEAVVLAVPLSVGNAIDGKMERMPRMISRNLLPEHPDVKVRKILDEALKDFIDDTESTTPASPSVPHPFGLNMPRSPSSARDRRYAAPPPPPNRDPTRYRPTREQQYRDRGISVSSRRDSGGSGSRDSGDWISEGGAAHSRHGSIPLSPASEKEKVHLPPPPPPVGYRNRSPQSRRYSHSAVNIMQSQPPPPPLMAKAEQPLPAATGGLLSPVGVYSPTSGSGPVQSPPSLSPEQLATIRDLSPRRERDKEYYNLQRQTSYFPSRTSRGSLDTTVGIPGQSCRASGSYREQRAERERPEGSSRATSRRRSTAASEDARGQPWDEYSRYKAA